jgi:hypothetical protein
MFCLLSVQQFQHTAKKSHKPQAKTKISKGKSFEAKTHTFFLATKTGKQKKTQKPRNQTDKQKLTNINEQT